MTTFEQAKKERDILADKVFCVSAQLKSFPAGAMGLTPDSVRGMPEWKALKQEYGIAFAKLRAFNTVFVKTYKTELAKERKAKYDRHKPNTPSPRHAARWLGTV